ncbi:MAG: MmcQ/YjbR family DNA-binding protein [Gemmatimonadaceae bacterium]
MKSVLDRVRKICLALPQAHEVIAWGEPTFRVRNKLFAMYASGQNHHGAGKNAIWCKATHIDQELLIKSDPERFFSPPYVGPSGWVGIYLDGSPDWEAVAAQLGDAYRLIAPKKLRDQPTDTPSPRKHSKAKATKPRRTGPAAKKR